MSTPREIEIKLELSPAIPAAAEENPLLQARKGGA
jgi:hypothetical protein